MNSIVERFIEHATRAATANGKLMDDWKREFATMLVHLVVSECAAVVDTITESEYGVANRWATGEDLIRHFGEELL